MNTIEQIREAHSLPEIRICKVAYGEGLEWKVANKMAIESTTGKLFGFHGENYRLVPHEVGISYVEEIAAKFENLLGPFTTSVKQFDEGRRIKATLLFPKTEYDIGKKDTVSPTIEYLNSYDGKWPETLTFGAYRLICSNGMIIGNKIFKEMLIHTGTRLTEQFFGKMEGSIHQLHNQSKIWKRWTQEEPTEEEVIAAIAVFGKKQQESLEEQVNKARAQKILTIWTFYNILTYAITHQVTSLTRQVNLERNLRPLVSQWEVGRIAA